MRRAGKNGETAFGVHGPHLANPCAPTWLSVKASRSSLEMVRSRTSASTASPLSMLPATRMATGTFAPWSSRQERRRPGLRLSAMRSRKATAALAEPPFSCRRSQGQTRARTRLKSPLVQNVCACKIPPKASVPETSGDKTSERRTLAARYSSSSSGVSSSTRSIAVSMRSNPLPPA